MAAPSPVVAEILNQFQRPAFHEAAEAGFALAGTRAAYHQAIALDRCAVRFDYRTRRPRGAIVTPKWCVSIRYDHGADLYDVTVQHVFADGRTGPEHTLHGYDVVALLGNTETVIRDAAKACRGE